jgi:hypothetical protein
MAKKERGLTLLTDVDRPAETSTVMEKLTEARLSFAIVPGEGSGPVLFSKEGTFSGVEGVQRYIEERKGREH